MLPACSGYPVEEPIYVIKGSARHKSAMSRTYTALLAHDIICVSLYERLKLSQECSDSNYTAGGKIRQIQCNCVCSVHPIYRQTDRYRYTTPCNLS